MKSIIIIVLILSSILGFSQNSFPSGTYSSDLGDIIIRNDSVISKGKSYYVFYYSSDENLTNGLTTVSYSSEDRRSKLVVVFKSGTPRHLMFDYKNYSEETFDVLFLKNK